MKEKEELPVNPPAKATHDGKQDDKIKTLVMVKGIGNMGATAEYDEMFEKFKLSAKHNAEMIAFDAVFADGVKEVTVKVSEIIYFVSAK